VDVLTALLQATVGDMQAENSLPEVLARTRRSAPTLALLLAVLQLSDPASVNEALHFYLTGVASYAGTGDDLRYMLASRGFASTGRANRWRPRRTAPTRADASPPVLDDEDAEQARLTPAEPRSTGPFEDPEGWLSRSTQGWLRVPAAGEPGQEGRGAGRLRSGSLRRLIDPLNEGRAPHRDPDGDDEDDE